MCNLYIHFDAELRFVQDANNNWVVNEAVLTDDNFIEIRAQLDALPRIDYVEKNIDL